MKIGIDYHGVITKYTKQFASLASQMFLAGNQIHIVTGHPITPEFEAKLNKTFPMMAVNKIYSTTDGLEARGFPFTIDNRGGKMFDKDVWEKEKAVYCELNKIDMMFDDSPDFGKYFTGKTIYMQVK